MIEILQNSDAAVEDVALQYIQTEIILTDLQDEYSQVYDRAMELQQKSLVGKNVAKDLSTVKKNLEDTAFKIESCKDALAKLKKYVEENLRQFFISRKNKLKKKRKSLEEEKQICFRKSLALAAQAAVLQEDVDWRKSISSPRSGKIVYNDPGLSVNQQLLLSEDWAFFKAEVDKYRRKSSVKDFSQTFKAKISFLSDDIERFNKIFKQGVTEVEVKKFIDSFR